MTSLIDVIFLLLLFFMLTSTFSKFADVELGASGGQSASAQTMVPAFVKLAADRVLLNGMEFEKDALVDEIERLQASSRVNAILMSVDEAANAQQLVDMLLILRRLPGIDVQIVR
ncbi:outer membrane transport energization protein ExbD [Hoeflea halophila]|uniref:Outer membrane transport energization protein ExbD n=1 Tax=Hoeflea halophila TaxID=714899 RepID=A0A286IFM9_9HYPH|nr:biopolymer transporter ExbD [Hoeflea halophila]SOE18871.1 outer membrane transport energization protein ExbD [Hoeflea halophila]